LKEKKNQRRYFICDRDHSYITWVVCSIVTPSCSNSKIDKADKADSTGDYQPICGLGSCYQEVIREEAPSIGD